MSCRPVSWPGSRAHPCTGVRRAPSENDSTQPEPCASRDAHATGVCRQRLAPESAQDTSMYDLVRSVPVKSGRAHQAGHQSRTMQRACLDYGTAGREQDGPNEGQNRPSRPDAIEKPQRTGLDKCTGNGANRPHPRTGVRRAPSKNDSTQPEPCASRGARATGVCRQRHAPEARGTLPCTIQYGVYQ